MSGWAEEFDVVVSGFGGVEHHAAGNASIVCDYRTGRLPRMPSHTVFDEHTSRSGNQRSGTTLARGTGSPCWQRAEYRRRMLVELEALDGVPRGFRKSLASVVGKKADDEEQDTDVHDSLKAIGNESRREPVGYERRAELVRQAAKSICDLGAHPEVAEPRRQHAYGALVMVGGPLHTCQDS